MVVHLAGSDGKLSAAHGPETHYADYARRPLLGAIACRTRASALGPCNTSFVVPIAILFVVQAL